MAGSGTRGRRVNLRVTIISSAPFCPQCIRPLPEPAPAKSQKCRTYVLSLWCDFGNFGNVPDGDLLAVLLAAADKIGWVGSDSLAAFLQSALGKSKMKATTPEYELAQKESEYNKASANERLLEKKLQKPTQNVESCGNNSRANRT